MNRNVICINTTSKKHGGLTRGIRLIKGSSLYELI